MSLKDIQGFSIQRARNPSPVETTSCQILPDSTIHPAVVPCTLVKQRFGLRVQNPEGRAEGFTLSLIRGIRVGSIVKYSSYEIVFAIWTACVTIYLPTEEAFDLKLQDTLGCYLVTFPYRAHKRISAFQRCPQAPAILIPALH